MSAAGKRVHGQVNGECTGKHTGKHGMHISSKT